MKVMTYTTSLRSAFFACLLSLGVPSLPAIDNFESLKVVTSVLPSYPLGMTVNGIYDGAARIIISVNENGVLEDVYVESYTHPQFGKLAAESIRKWTFQPAKLNGEPLSIIKAIDFDFEDRRGVFAFGIMESVAAKLNFARFAESKRIYSPKELDEIPKPIKMTTPLYPEEFKGQGTIGNVSVLFYIDETGEVRMPHVTEYSHESFGKTAIIAVEDWKFDPPLVRGKPVSIMVRQKFTFSESSK